jgi:toxin YoeB
VFPKKDIKKTTSTKLSKEKQLKKYSEKLKAKIEKSGKKLAQMSPFLEKSDIIQPTKVTLTYLNDAVENIFEKMKASKSDGNKLNDLLADIECQPWATKGGGKPEVLRYKFQNYKGCLSRRINDNDRLVYKVTGPGIILILSCIGHYK